MQMECTDAWPSENHFRNKLHKKIQNISFDAAIDTQAQVSIMPSSLVQGVITYDHPRSPFTRLQHKVLCSNLKTNKKPSDFDMTS